MKPLVQASRCAVVIFASLWCSWAQAIDIWDGGGGDDNWTTGGNWLALFGGGVPPSNDGTADILMQGTTRLTPNMDLAWDVNSLRFAGSAGAFTLGSSSNSSLILGAGGILNQSGVLQTIDHNITVGDDQTWTAEFGGLQVNGNVTQRGLLGPDLTIGGNYGTILSGRLGDLASLTKTGSQLLLLDGTIANTFTGPTYVNEGRLRLDKEVADGAIHGDLVIGDGVGIDRVILNRDEQILASPSHTVTVNSAGVFELASFEETLENLAVRGGTVEMIELGSRLNVTNLTMQGGWITNPTPPQVRPLYIYGSTVRSEAAATTALIDAFLDLSQAGGLVTFEVADGAPDIDLDLTHLVNGGLIKTGMGTLRVHGNSRPLGFHIVAGTLVVGDRPPGYDFFDFVFEGGTLRAEVSLGTAAGIQIVGAATIDGPNNLSLWGQISGPGGLTKRGSGTLTFGSSFPNTYTGPTTVEEGTLILDATDPDAAIFGSLVVGDGIGGPAAAVVRLDASEQIVSAPGHSVTVNASGYFDLNGRSETVQDLIINGGLAGGASGTLTAGSLTMQGGTVSTGSGKLIANGSVTTNAAAEPATISGRLELGGQTRTIAVADGPASIDLDVPAPISNGGIDKTAPGTLRLSGNNTFAGGVTVSAGTLLLDSAVGTATGTGPVTVLGGTLAGSGTIPGTLESRALVSPGMSVGTFNVGGDYAQILDGELLIELAAVDDFDRLLVTGNVDLDGRLTVGLIDGFLPTLGQTFAFLTAADVDGTFETEDLPLLSGLEFQVVYNDTSVALVVVSALAGDYNGNGTVDAADYTTWRDHLGQSFTLPNENPAAATPGVVDAEDYEFWKSKFGNLLGSGSMTAASAPEPATATFVSFGLLALILVCRFPSRFLTLK